MSTTNRTHRCRAWSALADLAGLFRIFSGTLVDSYRRRGKKPKPFPTTPPGRVEIGESTVTTYTFGSDLYADMIAAIDAAQKQVLGW